tara:strand:- start:230 stop:562 length:333 start_codon:yes stop_codon:yes gene_type:complete
VEAIEKKLANTAEKELFKRTDEVLHYLWDPIGVSDVPEARDEYHEYLPQIFMMIKGNKSEEEISSYMYKVQAEEIGIISNKNKISQVVKILIRWKEVIEEKNKTQSRLCQ